MITPIIVIPHRWARSRVCFGIISLTSRPRRRLQGYIYTLQLWNWSTEDEEHEETWRLCSTTWVLIHVKSTRTTSDGQQRGTDKEVFMTPRDKRRNEKSKRERESWSWLNSSKSALMGRPLSSARSDRSTLMYTESSVVSPKWIRALFKVGQQAGRPGWTSWHQEAWSAHCQNARTPPDPFFNLLCSAQSLGIMKWDPLGLETSRPPD